MPKLGANMWSCKLGRKDLIIARGQTAPGDGICIRNTEVYLEACDEVILRYLRFRMGDEARQQGDALGGQIRCMLEE